MPKRTNKNLLMGINCKWKAILNEQFPGCFLDEIPSETDVIMVDCSIAIRALSYFVYDGFTLKSRIIGFINKLTDYKPQKIILMFDEKEFVPKCKQATWDKRKNEKFEPYTISEMKEKDICFSDGKLPIMERVFCTPLLMEDLICFFCQTIEDIHKNAILECMIVVDGCIQSSRLKKLKKCDKNKGLEIDLEKPVRANIAYYRKDVTDPVYVDSFRIGETDLKIVKHIGLNSNKEITIFSSDSDSIPILLLNMRDWINKETGFLESTIYIDFGERSTKGLRFLHVTELYRLVARYMISIHIEHPIETMCILLILTGTDFVESQYFVGPSVIWSSFMKDNSIFRRGNTEHVFSSDDRIGDTHTRHSVTIAEHLLKKFIEVSSPANGKRKKMNKEETKKPEVVLSLDSCLRRGWWQLDYWINGGNSHPIDPIELREFKVEDIDKNGLIIYIDKKISVNGWLYDSQEKKVVPAQHVYKFMNRKI